MENNSYALFERETYEMEKAFEAIEYYADKCDFYVLSLVYGECYDCNKSYYRKKMVRIHITENNYSKVIVDGEETALTRLSKELNKTMEVTEDFRTIYLTGDYPVEIFEVVS